MKAEGTEQDERILTLTPTGRDSALLAGALAGAGLHAEVCADMDALCRAMTPLAAAVLIASEALTPSSLTQLRDALAQQPPWSDLPLIILTSGGRDPREKGPWAEALDALGNTTLLERPLRMATLIHAAQAAVGARRRQYEVRGLLEEHARMERHLQAEARKQRAFLRDVLASVTGGRLHLCDTPADLPARLPASGPPVPLTRTGGMSKLRRAAQEAALAEGFAADRWQDLLTAVGEAAMNAAVHGGGGVGRVCTGRDGIVQVWVEDRGRGIEVEDLPRAALSKGYTTAGSLGHGMKMMLETVDRLWLLTGPEGTTAVIEQDRLSPRRPGPKQTPGRTLWYNPRMEPDTQDPIVVITAVGRDQPGAVAALAKAVFDLGGNLDDAIMTRLHGAFTTMVAARLPEGRDEHDLRRALAPVAQSLGLSVTVQTIPAGPSEAPADLLLTVYGADQPGIVYKVAARLASRRINITDMDTRLTGTAGSPVYVMQLEVASGGADLNADLAALREELGVSISSQPLDTEAL